MPSVIFTQNLRRHTACPESAVSGDTVIEALGQVFARTPSLRGYILDDQGALRQHIQIFVDGILVGDRKTLSDAVKPDSEIFVLQALSGG